MRSLFYILAGLLPAWTLSAADIFVATRVETQAGYEQNRLEAPGSGSGSPLWQATPGLDVILFGEKTETSLGFDYRLTQYTQSGFESKDEATLFGLWRCFEGRNEAGLSAGSGLYRDKALPANDYVFWQARPFAIRTLESIPAELSLAGTFRQTFYDASVFTSVTDRAESRVEVRPGVRWHLSPQATLWAEFYAEWNMFEATEAEYSGMGGSLGCTLRPSAQWDLGAWAEAGTRSYDVAVEGLDRRDTPQRVGAWVTYRLRPWLDIFASADWESFASTIDRNEYSWWRAGGGVRLVFEHEVHQH